MSPEVIKQSLSFLEDEAVAIIRDQNKIEFNVDRSIDGKRPWLERVKIEILRERRQAMPANEHPAGTASGTSAAPGSPPN